MKKEIEKKHLEKEDKSKKSEKRIKKVDNKKEEKKTKAKKERKRRINIFKLIIDWFKNEIKELKEVSWPSKREIWKNFVATLLCVIFLGILFYIIDIIMVWLKTVVI